VEDAVPIADPNAQIYRCTWEDLAIITLSPEHAGQYTEFFDIGREWIDPPEGDFVHCCGYPRDRGAFLGTRNAGDKEEHSIGISPYVFDGQVLPSPTEDELKFKITAFHLERHLSLATIRSGFEINDIGEQARIPSAITLPPCSTCLACGGNSGLGSGVSSGSDNYTITVNAIAVGTNTTRVLGTLNVIVTH